jgi:hypothetical protein
MYQLGFCILCHVYYFCHIKGSYSSLFHYNVNKEKDKGEVMLASDKIAGAFLAIVEEAEKLKKSGLTVEAENAVKTIISIAKHQSDIRAAAGGTCAGQKSSCKHP